MKSRLAVAIAFLVAFTLSARAQTVASGTDIPHLISYQGFLTSADGKAVPDGLHHLAIGFYSDADGNAAPVWEDDFIVTTTNGVFSLLLGSGTPLPAATVMNAPLWLGVRVTDDASQPSTLLRPLAQLTSSPYAMTVANGAITKDKMGTDFVGSISINGQKVSAKGDDLNIITGDGINISVDPITKSLMLSSNTSGIDLTGKGALGQTLSDNYIQNTTTQQSGANFNIGGSGIIGTNLTVNGTSALKGAVTLGTASGTTAARLNFNDAHSSDSYAASITGASQYTGNRTYTLPDVGANANFVMTEGAQTINGKKSFTDTLTIGAVVATRSIIPNIDTVMSLGDSTHRFKDLFLSGHSLVMGTGNTQTEFSTDPSGGLVITSTSPTDSSTTSISSTGTMTTPTVSSDSISTTSLSTTSLTSSSLTTDSLSTTSLTSSSLTTDSLSTTSLTSSSLTTDALSTSSLTSSSLTSDSITTTSLSSGSLTTTDAIVSGGPISTGDSIYSAGTIESGNSIWVRGNTTPRKIEGDETMNIYTDNGDLLLNPASGLTGVGIAYPNHPDATLEVNGTIHGTGNATLGGILNMSSHQINNVADPSSAQDAATKNYVDNLVATAENQDASDDAAALLVETNRAEGAENSLTTNLNQEVSNRQTAVTNEANARTSADNTLQSNIDAEAASRTSADNTLTTNLNQEVSNRQTAVTNEANARTSADNTLQSNIDAEAASRTSGDNTLTTNLNSEVSNRQTAVTNEANARTSADNTLQSNIDAEAAARTSAENTLTTNLNNEVSRAQAAEATKLSLSGGTMTGAINMGSNSISNVTDPTNAQDAATKHYVDNSTSTAISGTVNTLAKFTGANSVGNSGLTDDGSTLSYSGAANLGTAGGHVGIGTTNPIADLANTSDNNLGSDTHGISQHSMAWATTVTTGYVATFTNEASGGGQAHDGVAVKVYDNTSNTEAFDVSQGNSVSAGTQLLGVKANGDVNIGSHVGNVSIGNTSGTTQIVGNGWSINTAGSAALNSVSANSLLTIGTQTADPVSPSSDTRLRLKAINGNSATYDYGVVSNGNLGYVESYYDQYGFYLDDDNNNGGGVSFTINRGASHAGSPVQLLSLNGSGNLTVPGTMTGANVTSTGNLTVGGTLSLAGPLSSGGTGSSGQVLTSNGASAPTWQSLPAQALIANPNGSIQNGASGDARGTNAVDLQNQRSASNEVASGSNSVIVGGANNRAAGISSALVGGTSNQSLGDNSFLGAGVSNTSQGLRSVVGGGESNNAANNYATIAGGRSNTAANTGATIGGGESNNASGIDATVVGGNSNNASGDYSVAMGSSATASNSGSFVFGDHSGTATASNANNSFTARASGGYRFFDDGTSTPALTIASNAASFAGSVNVGADLKANGSSGTSGQVLTSNGSGSAPSWQAAIPSGAMFFFPNNNSRTGFTYIGQTTTISTSGAWSSKTSMSNARRVLAAAAVNGKIYAVGGNSTSGNFSACEEYDPATDSWTTKASMAQARGELTAAAPGNGKLYAIGGVTNTDVATVEEFDPSANTWTNKASLPQARADMASAAPGNGKLYIFGGDFSGNATTSCLEYDPSANSWSAKASMSTARFLLAGVALNGKIYAIGGDAGGGNWQSACEEYDATANTWTTRASMPTARGYLAAAAPGNGRLYAFGGYNGNLLSTNEEFDPVSNTWSSRPSMSTATWYLAGASTGNGSLYAIGGGTNSAFAVASMQQYSVQMLMYLFTKD